MKEGFDNKDIRLIEGRGLTVAAVERQLDNFRKGFCFLPVSRAAVINDGIIRLANDEISRLEHKYEDSAPALDIVKFVPASGAATRMFKDLYEFRNERKRSQETNILLENLDRFAFYPYLKDITQGRATDEKTVDAIIGKEGLDYGSKPKALILFHNYSDGGRTALEEHLVEGAVYAAGQGSVKIHFTVSPEHLEGFEELMADKLPFYEQKLGVKYDITYSFQKSSTDIIAVTPDNEPFREADGSLLFRPAGHGALIDNLNDIDADIIFVKTVDNVTTDRLRGDTVRYKKALAGLLLSLQEDICRYISSLGSEISDGKICETTGFITGRLGRKLPVSFAGMELTDKADYLLDLFDRPLRVCGMVRNEGEPGGGPFWVDEGDGAESLQIAESSQIAPEQKGLMQNATHFNPVDIVCGVRNCGGDKYDLSRFIDPSTGFISNKSKDGRELKAQELPGLWNGAMARWNTVFVEVPISTFSPVKVVTDLLREQHTQSE